MMYSGGYVVSILSNNKEVLDELKDGTVAIQFGDHYSIRLRNKNAWRCVAKIFIDDENVSGGGYIIDAYGVIDIERYNNVAQKFKLVAATSNAAKREGKGVRNDGANGVIRVEFYKEKPYEPVASIPMVPYTPVQPWTSPWIYPKKHISMTNNIYTEGYNSASFEREEYTSGSIDGGLVFGLCDDSVKKEQSVTVKGDVSAQSFYYIHIDIEPEATIIQLKLVGQTKPLVKKPEYCSNCGKKVGKTDNFCSVCGRRV